MASRRITAFVSPALAEPPHNTRFHPTPLYGSKIVSILKPGFGSTDISIYPAARVKRKPFGHLRRAHLLA